MRKISGMPEVTLLEDSDILPIVNTSMGNYGSASVKISRLIENIFRLTMASSIPWSKINKAEIDLTGANGADLTITEPYHMLARLGTDLTEEIPVTEFVMSALGQPTSAEFRAAIGAVADHSELTSKGEITHPEIDNHINNGNLHYILSDLEVSETMAWSSQQIANRFALLADIKKHSDLEEIGEYTHAHIDEHINDTTQHTDTTNHTQLTNIGDSTHEQIDDHIQDIILHNNDHNNITNRGTRTHLEIDNHIATAGIHTNIIYGTDAPPEEVSQLTEGTLYLRYM